MDFSLAFFILLRLDLKLIKILKILITTLVFFLKYVDRINVLGIDNLIMDIETEDREIELRESERRERERRERERRERDLRERVRDQL